MCKCCQHCFETCYWHLIEKRFCFDESIASYQEPITKEEKNNNFDNMAFYDSVSVIAGRAIVTIDPLPLKRKPTIVNQQPRRLTNDLLRTESIKTTKHSDAPDGTTSGTETQEDETKQDKLEEELAHLKPTVKKTVSFHNIVAKTIDAPPESSHESLSVPESPVELRRKSLRERRMSKSLTLKLSLSQELPIIRQNSVPKFFLDSPDEHNTESTLIKNPLTALQSAKVSTEEFTYDLKSVVHMENTRQQQQKEMPTVHRASSKISLKDRMKLRKSKSTVSASNVPHINYI